jgi:hypothetical protein
MATDLEALHTRRVTAVDDELPDTTLFWRWVGKATRPVIGWVFTGIGVILIIVGYLGVSREALVAKQLPYLVSGGILGIAFVGFGAVLLGTEDIRRDSGRLDRLEQMVAELHSLLLVRADGSPIVTDATAAAAGNGLATEAADAAGTTRVLALPEGQSFHRAECVMIEGKSQARPVTAKVVQERGLKPCKLCEPAPTGA